jgi:hypothetical protein
MLAIVSAAVVVVACGSEPKKDPTASTATAVASSPPPIDSSTASTADAAAPTSSGGADAGGKSDKQTECDALIDDANSTLDAERIAVDKECKKDADCVSIKGRACNFNCTNGAIPKALEKDWTAKVTKVKDGQCKKWTDNECAKLKTKPLPTCQDKKVVCEKGHCNLK